ncbi:MAG: low specificity L-threonine aldolase [Salaquimonas sp.]
MFFASDNWSGVAPQINQALLDNNSGKVSGYGAGVLDKKVEAKLSEIFEREVVVFFVSTGTAANSIAIAATAKPGSVTFCHTESHVNVDECGGPEFFSASRLCSVPGKNAKMDLAELKAAIARYPASFVHHGRPGGITLTQSTELGTLYSLEEIQAFSDVAKEHDISLHMDGARFANAIASMKVSPAEMTWKSGVDFLSFGGTKNGCWCAEALICFDPSRRDELAFHHKRAGQLFSKSRFISAQFDAYLKDDLWLDLATHSNQMAEQLASKIKALNTVQLAWEREANELFVVINKQKAAELHSKGAKFFDWQVPSAHSDLLKEGEELYRLVTSFATTSEEVDQFMACLSA